MPGSQKLPCVPSCLSLTARCLALAGSQKGRGTARRSSEHILPHAGRPRSPWNSIAETETPVRVPVRMGRLQVFLCLPSGICLATTKYLPKILHSGFHLPDSAFSLHKSWDSKVVNDKRRFLHSGPALPAVSFQSDTRMPDSFKAEIGGTENRMDLGERLLSSGERRRRLNSQHRILLLKPPFSTGECLLVIQLG
ncbi:uncharacterized protein [Ciconia boyciana]|uniref:uncharacterized protein isoform X7 n=1 Tax=Ciconia boyciana TaxID=52775 RepID=UPI003BA0683D